MSEKKHKNDEIIEEINLKGQEVVDYVKDLVQKGNVRRLIVRKTNGDEIIQIPLTAAVVGAGALVVLAAPLAILATAVAFFAEIKLEVVRIADAEDHLVGEDDPTTAQRKNKIDIE